MYITTFKYMSFFKIIFLVIHNAFIKFGLSHNQKLFAIGF